MTLHFLIKTQISLDNCVKFENGMVLERHEEIRAILRDRLGGQTAALFAEPLLSRGNDAAPASVTWYSEIEGKARPLSTLPASAKSAVEAYLADSLAPLRLLLDDPEVGQLLRTALWQMNTSDILVVAGRAVLVNWGMRPAHLGTNASALSAHYAGTLGRYLPLTNPLGLSGRALQEAPGASAVASVPAEAGASGAANAGMTAIGQAGTPYTQSAIGANTGGADTRPPSDPSPTGSDSARAVLPLVAWLPLSVLLLLAMLVLAWLLLPGTRLFPVASTAPAVTNQDAVSLAEEVARDLRARRAALRASLDGAMCRPDGTFVLPTGLTPDGLMPTVPRAPGAAPAEGDAPGDEVRAAQNSALPPNPERVVVRDPTAGPDAGTGALPTMSLLQLLEIRTVLVLGVSGNSVSNGTGFVVGPGLILTNNHVIDEALRSGGQIIVFNSALPRPQPAEVLKTQGPLEQSGGDYALLRIADTSLPAFQLHQAQTALTLTNVVAAGFPGDILEIDSQFASLMRGNLGAVPALSVTDGAVITEQSLASRTNVLVHSAPISTGNSGGPLVDYCGRVVGINTFVRRGDLRTLNFALAGQDVLLFLQDTVASPVVVTEACTPQVTRPAPAVAAPAALLDPGEPGDSRGVAPAATQPEGE